MGIISKRAIRAYMNRPLRDSARVKRLTTEQLDARLAALNPPPRFHTPPRDHQKAAFLLGVKYPSYLFFLDMGTGKTAVSLYLFDYFRSGRAIVLVPFGSNLAQWEDQVRIHTPHLKVTQVDGQGEGERWLQVKNPNADIVVMTYAGLLNLVCDSVKAKKKMVWKENPARLKAFCKQFDFFIGDEFSQLCGRHDSLTTRVVRKLAWSCARRYALTGTPYGKDPQALWSQFYCMEKGITLGETLGLFRAALFTEKRNYWGGMVYTFNERKKRILNRLLRNRSIRYRADECLDLPEKSFQILPVAFDAETHVYYDRLVDQIIKSKDDFQVRKNSFINLRQLAAGYLVLKNENDERQTIRFSRSPKMQAVIDLIQTLPPDQKVVVFHEYKLTGGFFSEMLTANKIKHVRLFSGTKDKGAAVTQFLTNPKIRVMLSSSAGALGGNWQASRYLLWLERSCDPKINEQEERRVWRMGQTKKVFLWSAVVRGSIDEKIEANLKAGRNLMDALIDGKGLEKLRRVAGK